ncbi:hypothetical protein ACHAWC_002911 [Mediolabrus comicus]
MDLRSDAYDEELLSTTATRGTSVSSSSTSPRRSSPRRSSTRRSRTREYNLPRTPKSSSKKRSSKTTSPSASSSHRQPQPPRVTPLAISQMTEAQRSKLQTNLQQTISHTHYSSWNDTGPVMKHDSSSKNYPSPTRLNQIPRSSRRNNSSSRSKAASGAAVTEDYSLETDDNKIGVERALETVDAAGGATNDDDDTESQYSDLYTAHHKQRYAPLSTFFVICQVIILPLMMWQCGVAPLEMNPMIGPYPDALNYWGAKNAVLIIDDGELYRLVTPIFLHAGLIHLAGNVLVQIDSGNRWEKEWGSLIWIIVYLGSAIGSSVLSVIAMPDQISVGSSGAIMGLFGAKFAEIIVLLCEKGRTVRELAAQESRKEQRVHVIFGIVIVMAMSFIPYVDWAAHLGGLVVGFFIGLVCFSFTMRNKFGTVFWLGVGIAGGIILYSTFIAIMFTTETDDQMRDICGYYQQHFENYECKCMLNEAIQFGSWEIGGNGSNSGAWANNKNNNNNNNNKDEDGPGGEDGEGEGKDGNKFLM